MVLELLVVAGLLVVGWGLLVKRHPTETGELKTGLSVAFKWVKNLFVKK